MKNKKEENKKTKELIKQFKTEAKEEIMHIEGFEDYRVFDCFNQKYIYEPSKINQFYNSFYKNCIPAKWQKVDFNQATIEKKLTTLFNKESFQCFSRSGNTEKSFDDLKDCKAIYLEWNTGGEFDLFFCNSFELENPQLPSYEDWLADWNYGTSAIDITPLFDVFEDEEFLENSTLQKALLNYINGKLLACVISAWNNSQLNKYPIAFAQHDADAVTASPK